MAQGRLIVIEGLDGCGKSTQLGAMQERFPDMRFLSFPDYASDSGRLVRQYLDGAFPEPDPVHSAYSASSFYAADRYVNYKRCWEAAYREGVHFLSARYTTSNVIYQMTKLPRSEWESYCRWLYDYEYDKLGLPRPDAVIFLDVPVEVSQGLLSSRYAGDEQKKDIHEADTAYLRACREAAMYAAAREGWQVLDCCRGNVMRPAGEISEELAGLIGAALAKA